MNRKPLSRHVGATIARKRRQLGLSQEGLAEKVGISQESLSRMEKGSIAPKFERLQAFADALDCQVADLFRLRERGESEYARHIADAIRPLSMEAQNEIAEIVTRVVRFMQHGSPM